MPTVAESETTQKDCSGENNRKVIYDFDRFLLWMHHHEAITIEKTHTVAFCSVIRKGMSSMKSTAAKQKKAKVRVLR